MLSPGSGQGLGSVLAQKVGGLFGINLPSVASTLPLGANAATAATALGGVATQGALAASALSSVATSSAASGAGSALGGAGGVLGFLSKVPILGSIFSLFGGGAAGAVPGSEVAADAFAAFAALEKGGIIPSAAGGMVAPGGGTLALLHPREMVLPAHISQTVQNLANSGGGSPNNFSFTNHFSGSGGSARASDLNRGIENYARNWLRNQGLRA